MVDTSSFSEEQIQQSLRSQAVRHVDFYLRLLIAYFVKINRLLWPTTLYLLIVSFFLKVFSKFVQGVRTPNFGESVENED